MYQIKFVIIKRLLEGKKFAEESFTKFILQFALQSKKKSCVKMK